MQGAQKTQTQSENQHQVTAPARVTLCLGVAAFFVIAAGVAACKNKAPAATADPPQSTSGATDGVKVSPATAKQGPYTVKASAVSLKKGETSIATVEITPNKPWKLNLDYPTKAVVVGAAAVATPKANYGKTDIPLTEKGMKLNVSLQGVEVGEASVSARVHFAVCTEETCVPKTEKVSWKVTVSE
jgi:hypothetical protein